MVYSPSIGPGPLNTAGLAPELPSYHAGPSGRPVESKFGSLWATRRPTGSPSVSFPARRVPGWRILCRTGGNARTLRIRTASGRRRIGWKWPAGSRHVCPTRDAGYRVQNSLQVAGGTLDPMGHACRMSPVCPRAAYPLSERKTITISASASASISSSARGQQTSMLA